jgi:hypothetical protein
MIDDGKVERFAQQGCWLTCHNGERDMPNQFTPQEVEANARRRLRRPRPEGREASRSARAGAD